jgi:hypothetical protein
VLLDEPLPDNVDVSPACFECNNGLATDEEYLACLLECVVAGDVDPDKVTRPKVAHILRTQPKLVERLKAARIPTQGQPIWRFEEERVRNVIMKLAHGHSAYELNDPHHMEEPEGYVVKPLAVMTQSEREEFEERPNPEEFEYGTWPEVGSRMMQRLMVVVSGEEPIGVFEEGWLVVQEGRYRYRVSWDGGTRIRMVLYEYLAADVWWE